MCNCKNITPQSQECYDQMIVVDIPDHMASYRDNRLASGLSGMICIDPCVIDEIRDLWDKGIHTRGCCCGHNILQSFVNVAPESIEQMLNMGYVQNHHDPGRKDTFRMKTV